MGFHQLRSAQNATDSRVLLADSGQFMNDWELSPTEKAMQQTVTTDTNPLFKAIGSVFDFAGSAVDGVLNAVDGLQDNVRAGWELFRAADPDTVKKIELKDIQYTVQAGDTLSEISERLTGNAFLADEIASVNGLQDKNRIQVGQTLTIPCMPDTEKVQSYSRESFKEWAGISVEQARSRYFEDTGRSIKESEIKRLFEYPEYTKQQLLNDKTLHVEFRDILNKDVPDIEPVNSQDWKKLGFIRSFFHAPYLGFSKYISTTGYREAVYNLDGRRTDNNWVKGTFNFFDPVTQPKAHALADVAPYNRWGN